MQSFKEHIASKFSNGTKWFGTEVVLFSLIASSFDIWEQRQKVVQIHNGLR